MFSWIKYGSIIGPWGIESYLYSLPFNFFPMLVIAGICLFICWRTISISNLLKKILIDCLVVALSVVVVNYFFFFITSLSTSWGGTIFNGVLTLTIIELWAVSWQKREAANIQYMMEKEIIARKYEIIKAYVNPHFLYNSLDVLCSLIDSHGKNESLEFALSFSSYYRRLTNLMNVRKSSLRDELEMVENYLNLVARQYGDNLRFSVKGNADADATVIPCAIQLLVENAIKHNVINSEHPMEIRLNIDENDLTVTNNCNLKKTHNSLTERGMGLKYLENIYGSYGKTITVKHFGDSFSVSIPKRL